MDDPQEADAYVNAIARDWRTAPLSDEDRALCEFAAKLTHDQHQATSADLDALREQGFDDRAIHDAAQVIGYFNYITRIADSLGVEPEDFIRPWG
ncbi:MAG: peroxidase, partial [Anaerolineales bacterium]